MTAQRDRTPRSETSGRTVNALPEWSETTYEDTKGFRTQGAQTSRGSHFAAVGNKASGSFSSQPKKVSEVSVTDKDYIDAKTDAARAQNDARFAEVLATLKTLQDTSITWKSVWGAAAATTVAVASIVLAVLAIAGDRFDGGMAASGVVSSVLNEQKTRDAAQDQRLSEVLDRLDGITGRLDAQPASPATSAAPAGATSGN